MTTQTTNGKEEEIPICCPGCKYRFHKDEKEAVEKQAVQRFIDAPVVYNKVFKAKGKVYLIDFENEEVSMDNLGGAPAERMIESFHNIDFYPSEE